ncbi:MAG: hypothetical protein IJO63_04995 [Bacilli bacterium]|nr:hypothetical protein [Bacilli bacterium]
MKKCYLLIASFLLLFICAPNFVNAQDYVNDLGVVIPEEDYNNLKLLYTEAHIAVLDQNKYDQIKSMNLDYDSVQVQNKYVKTEINNVTGEVTETEISKEEYETVSPNYLTRATLIGTSYKQLSLGFSRTSDSAHTAFFTLNAIWKIMPVVRSFDVIGVRLSNLSVINGTQQGQQIYKINDGSYQWVQYNFNGTNIQNHSNGFGISMNLLNDTSLTYLECTIDANMSINAYPAAVFGSYQHAIENVSLATSQSYTIGAGGLGSVFIFPNDTIRLKYDGMNGVYDYISS